MHNTKLVLSSIQTTRNEWHSRVKETHKLHGNMVDYKTNIETTKVAYKLNFVLNAITHLIQCGIDLLPFFLYTALLLIVIGIRHVLCFTVIAVTRTTSIIVLVKHSLLLHLLL
uniref:Uncharacterized protein n=1 Tax=Lygus hesperus TaxID=30085 RepID=A0A146L6E0_LYGHE